jgi:hypothetical protein
MVVFSGTVQSDFLKRLPSELDNKEKLIDFSASDFETLRQNLIRYVQATFPLDYNNFESSDFGMLLLEMMAAIGHIQSHKSDYLANENYIGTARSRDSIKKLLEVIGIRLKGPISAAANASLTYQTLESPSSVVVNGADRTITITSPEDGASLSYTLYKVNPNGTVDLENATEDLQFEVSATAGTVTITDAVLLEGALVIETGSFTSPESIKSITLTQSPYVEKSAQVFVEGSTETEGIYSEEENLYYASGPNDKVFEVTTDTSFRASLLFGDDSIGQSPAFGDTYKVLYRVGGGTRGNVAEGVINTLIPITEYNTTGTQQVDATLENTSLGTGGRDAESIAQAKRYAPLFFKSQDRLVTLPDFKGFANSFASNYGSTGKATAAVRRAYSSANIIDVFILERASDTQLRRATKEYKKQLLEAMDEKKMLTDEIVVVDGLIRTLDLFVTITLDKKYRREESIFKARTRSIIETYMNMDNTDFAEPFVPQDLIRYLLDKEASIRYATVDNVSDKIKVGFNEIIQLNNLTINVQYV